MIKKVLLFIIVVLITGIFVYKGVMFDIKNKILGNPKIIWIGCPMVSDNDLFTPSQGWISSVEIGLREDGIVIWREKK